MSTITITRRIHAPVEVVFKTISDIRNFSKAVPDILDVEFLSDQKTGVETRFKETREFKGRKMSTVLEVTEFIEMRRSGWFPTRREQFGIRFSHWRNLMEVPN